MRMQGEPQQRRQSHGSRKTRRRELLQEMVDDDLPARGRCAGRINPGQSVIGACLAARTIASVSHDWPQGDWCTGKGQRA